LAGGSNSPAPVQIQSATAVHDTYQQNRRIVLHPKNSFARMNGFTYIRAQKGATEARSNKKAEVIAMMKRAKGATLAEIMKATAWQRHTVRGS
jgi:hypothetical protein